jgi:hypothetical protein
MSYFCTLKGLLYLTYDSGGGNGPFGLGWTHAEAE